MARNGPVASGSVWESGVASTGRHRRGAARPILRAAGHQPVSLADDEGTSMSMGSSGGGSGPGGGSGGRNDCLAAALGRGSFDSPSPWNGRITTVRIPVLDGIFHIGWHPLSVSLSLSLSASSMSLQQRRSERWNRSEETSLLSISFAIFLNPSSRPSLRVNLRLLVIPSELDA
jgi:hypothetical protein